MSKNESAAALDCTNGGDCHCDQFVGLAHEWLKSSCAHDLSIDQQLHPIKTFIELLQRRLEFADHLGIRPGTKRLPAMGARRRSRPQQLSPDYACFLGRRKRSAEPDDVRREALRSFAER